MKPVKLSELVEAFKKPDRTRRRSWVDRETGSIICVDDALTRAIAKGYDDALAEWGKEEVQNARAIVEDFGDRFVPVRWEYYEYSQIRPFIETVGDHETAKQLGRGISAAVEPPHIRFSRAASRLGVFEQWQVHLANARSGFVREWAEQFQIPFVDDLTRIPGP